MGRTGHRAVLMSAATGLIAIFSGLASATTLSFSDRSDLPRWATVNDTVMGGRSASTIARADDSHLFTGSVSLENNGGFASVRYLIGRDLPDAERVSLRVRGDGQLYQLRFQMGGRFRPVSYSVSFQTIANEWQTFTFLTEDFQPVWRGRKVQGAPPLTTDQAEQLSVYITDKQTGPFALQLDSVTFLSR